MSFPRFPCACAILLGLTLQALTSSAATGTIADVQHVVIFIQENRSFDNYFGAYKAVRGFNDRNALRFQNGTADFYQPQGNGYVLPYHSTNQCLNDLAHDWITGHAAWDLGKWDEWVLAKGASALTYYTRTDLQYYYALADAYTICDDYFCSVLGPTNPNRLYTMTGMIDPNGTGGGPVIDNSEPGFSWTTYPERLQKAGVSWKVYQQADNYDDNALAWFKQYRTAGPGNPLHDRGMATVGSLVAAFRADVTNNSLPQVSWLIAPTALSEHPDFPPVNGAALTAQLLGALASNPAVLNTTVFILTYDENGGFFDHVPAPTPPAGTPDEFVSGLPIGLGPRVPTIIVSPWTRGGYICSQVFDHTSLLQFVEKWTGVAEPNISAWRRTICGDMTSAFDFAHPDYTQPLLPTVATVSCSGVTPPVPSPQIAPAQESGSARARVLPYQLTATSSADCLLSQFYITLFNSGAASAHVSIYPNAFRSDGPWQYDVAPGATLTDYFNAGLFGGGKYDLTAYGPNGFQRRFAGDLNTSCNQYEASAQLDETNSTVTLNLRNSGASAVNFTITANAFLGGGPWIYPVSAGSTFSPTFYVATNGNWYDLKVTVAVDSSFVRGFAGHIEPSPTAQGTALRFSTTAGAIHFSWTPNPGLKLQVTPDLGSTNWVDVPGSVGVGSVDLPMTGAVEFFRLSQ
ncbi:MAG TPA: phospholipase C, phosphocholine-specific [Verrucomicrobiae bacterium]|nr:phospholipase C, phosphocholine-specific [Verrucomicrobiae bacterium]